ncbi:hypothetical protein Fleli_0154 [Bernardetia litoralis DSM 6794]|uniref:Uncharacterized protein n=1 Tax=Bernardetia litoralis (strain ATCC 23117 / DSM 6794 / NBRC 15988 / NCIMB 1366 / Fx l1 / Sio-4) TaxID=880071 RepID=I4AFB8_BERLS|nr:hypothetical protein [Bernardetia litoralis]AFM02653.1 hypothetical protein Fleli_0154 [Bernardetia litoralis DSM 6794]
MKNIVILCNLLLISQYVYSQVSNSDSLCNTSWRLDYSTSVKKKDSGIYVIEKHFMDKEQNYTSISETGNAKRYLAFDSCQKSILYYKHNFVTTYDKDRMVKVDRLIDSLTIFAFSKYKLREIGNELFVILENYTDVRFNESSEEKIFKIVFISTQTLFLMDQDNYIQVYTKNNVERGTSNVEEDDYFLMNILADYFDSKNIPYKIEDNKIISDALEKIDKN